MTLANFRKRSELFAELDSAAAGNHRAKEALANLLAVHVRTSQLIAAGIPIETVPPKRCVLLVGDDEAGTTALARAIAKSVGGPVVEANAKDYSDAGYVGKNVADLEIALLDEAGGDLLAAKFGTIVIHGLDSQRKRNFGGQDDVQGEAVQRALIPLIRGLQFNRQLMYGSPGLDSGHILFIATGAFDGLFDCVRRRVNRGFDVDTAEIADEAILQQVDREDLIAYGFVPELVRLFDIVPLKLASADELRRFQREQSSALKRIEFYFTIHGIRLVVESSAMDLLIGRHIADGRQHSLDELLLRTLAAELGEIDDLREQGIGEVLVDAAVVRGELPPWRVPIQRTGTAPLDVLLPEASTKRPAVSSSSIVTPPDRHDDAVRQTIEGLKNIIDWDNAREDARAWWQEFELMHEGDPETVIWLGEEIGGRGATLNEFFLNHMHWEEDDGISITLRLMDYRRLLNEKQAERSSPPTDD